MINDRGLAVNRIFSCLMWRVPLIVLIGAGLWVYGSAVRADIPVNIPQELKAAVGQSMRSVEPTGLHRYVSQNPSNGLALGFDPEGMRLAPAERAPGWQLGLKLKGYGLPGAARPVQEAELAAIGQRIEYRRGPITEWYENRPEGLEQGFTLTQPPVGGAGTIELVLGMSGELRAELDGDAHGVRLSDKDGHAVLAYRNLDVVDAQGRHLPAWLALAGESLAIRVDTRGAVWPVVVDPEIYSLGAKLTAQNPDGSSDSQASGHSGWAIALSQDGNTALVGANGASMAGLEKAGAVYVYKRNGQTWAIQQKLTAKNPDGSDDGTGGGFFGYSVALSADGNTALVGAYGGRVSGNAQAGAVYVYAYDSGAWAVQQKLTAQTNAGDDVQAAASFGYSVALSGDAKTALVGATGYKEAGLALAGSAYLYGRTGAHWSFRQKLTATNKDGGEDTQLFAAFGASTALSEDGGTALVGAPGYTVAGGQYAGAAYLFGRTGSSWTLQDKLIAQTSDGEDTEANSGFGAKVVLSSDGMTALVGAPGRNVGTDMYAGAAYVYGRTGGSWSVRQKLTAQADGNVDDSQAGALFGSSIALSPRGDAAVIGGPGAAVSGQESAGALYSYRLSEEGWSIRQKLTARTSAGSDITANAYFGYPVALSSDGAILMVGANRTAVSGLAEAGAVYATAKAATTVALTASNVRPRYGDVVSLTSEVSGSSPTGPVSFHDSGKELGSANLSNGRAVLAVNTLGLGGHSITAHYGGDAGNVANDSSPVSVEVVDDTPPLITLNSPADGQSYLQNSSVIADYVCADAVSGVAGCAGPVASGAPVDTSKRGAASFTVVAKDGAGNTASVTHSYKVTPLFSILTVVRSGSGAVTSSPPGIACGKQCGAVFAKGAYVTLTATPAGGFQFGGWKGPCVGTGPCIVTVNGLKQVKAYFKPIPRPPKTAGTDAGESEPDD